MLNNMSTADNNKDITVSVCDNCGKEGSDVTNICNKCKNATYCNAACKKKHRHKHKKECEEYLRLAAEKHDEELRIAAELHDIELFKQLPQKEDCSICFVRLPTLKQGKTYMNCCGKIICNGCIYAPVYDNHGNEVDNQKCPFCRTPTPTKDEEMIKRYKKRVELNDAYAIYTIGVYYREGSNGFPQSFAKALELYHRAVELGYTEAYTSIGYAYDHGRGVEVEKKKAIYYYELAAMGGDEAARHNLGIKEAKAGNEGRALKHFMVAARDGYAKSLENIKLMYSYGRATKEDYMTALQSYQAYLEEIKSKQRDEAAAADDQYRYY